MRAVKIKIAVVGNREGWSQKVVHRTLEKFAVRHPDMIISGGAKGVDTYAQSYARKEGLSILIIYPDWKKHGIGAGMIRNKEIAEQCDIIIAFDKKIKSGTANTIKHGREMGKPIYIIRTDKL